MKNKETSRTVRCLFCCVSNYSGCIQCAESADKYQPAIAIPIEIPPIAIRMHIRISTTSMMIFVDFFIAIYPFKRGFVIV